MLSVINFFITITINTIVVLNQCNKTWIIYMVMILVVLTCALVCTEEHDTNTRGVPGKPGRTQEETCPSSQWSEDRALQEESPTWTFRPGEQPPSGSDTRQEEEEAPQQETDNGKSNTVVLLFCFRLCGGIFSIQSLESRPLGHTTLLEHWQWLMKWSHVYTCYKAAFLKGGYLKGS